MSRTTKRALVGILLPSFGLMLSLAPAWAGQPPAATGEKKQAAHPHQLPAKKVVKVTAPAAMKGDDASEALRKEVQAKYTAVMEAFVNKDMAGFEKNWTPTFSQHDANGKTRSRAQIAADDKRFRNRFLTVTKIDVEVGAVTITGNSATVDVKFKFVGTEHGTAKTFSFSSENTDTWTKLGAAWMLEKTDVHSVSLS